MDLTPRLKFEVATDSINLVKNPSGERGAWFYTTPVANTSLSTIDVRTNLATNPSFETNTTGWSFSATYPNTTLTRQSGAGKYGTYALRIKNTGASSDWTSAINTVSGIVAGETYTFQADLKTVSGTLSKGIWLVWQDNSSVTVRDDGYLGLGTANTSWSTMQHMATAPVGATKVIVRFYVHQPAGYETDLDGFMVEQATAYNPYFDGSTGGTWAGTAHASTSTIEVTGALGDKLTFKTTVSQPSYFTTNFMPVTAGEYVSSRIDLTKISASHNIKIRYNWYNASEVLLSSSVLSGALSTIGTNIGPTIVAPANTAWFKMVVYIENGSTQASANAAVTFNKVMAKVTPSGSATSQRINLVTNPNFATASTGWVADNDNTTVGRTTAKQYSGTGAGFVRRDGSLGWGIARTGNITVTPKQTYTVSGYVSEYPGDAVSKSKIGVEWFTTSGKSLGIKWGATVNPGSGWSRLTMTGTAPSSAVKAQVRVASYSSATQILVFDAVLFEQSGAVGDYFDGATTDTAQVTYDWTSAANASTSTATSTSTYFDYVDPYDWRDILGPTADIKVDRGGLDIGTLTAVIKDAKLDPVDSEVLAEGRTVRLRALKGTVWTNVYEGQIDTLNVTYPAEAKPYGEVKVKTNIELVAIDNIQNLAEHKFVDSNGKSIGVALDQIPGIIEGANVPWLVNGSSSQVSTISKLNVSDDASALDQIAIARDSALGLAYVNKENVLVAVDAAHRDDTVKASLSDTNILNGVQDGTAWSTSGWGVYNDDWYWGTGATYTLETGSGLDAYDTFYRSVDTGTSNKAAFTLTPNVYTGNGVIVDVGDVFVINAWVRSSIDTKVRVFGDGDEGGYYSDSGGTEVMANVWTQIRAEINPVEADDTRIGLVLWSFGGGTGDSLDVTGLFVEQIANPIPSYSDIQLTYSTDDIVNSVTVNKLSNNANNTQPFAYGPYKDTASIAKYGEYTGEYPYQGSSPATFAQSILDARAWPVRRVQSLTMPVFLTNDTWDYAIDLDLYDVVHVKYADKIDDDQRITRISHQFTVHADRHTWDVVYGFDTVSGTASPRTTGGTGATTSKSSFAAVMQTNAQSIPANTTTAVNWNTTVANNPEMTVSSSGITVNQNGWYRISGQVGLENSGVTGVIQIALLVNGSSNRVMHRGSYAATLTTVSGEAVVSLNAGDIVTLGVVQNNGGTRTLIGGTSNVTTMEVHPL